MNGYNTVKCDGVNTVATEFSGADAYQSGLEGIAWDPGLNSFFVIKEKRAWRTS